MRSIPEYIYTWDIFNMVWYIVHIYLSKVEYVEAELRVEKINA